MLLQLSDRGPDSAGVAVYRDPAPTGVEGVAVQPRPAAGLGRVRDGLDEAFGAGEPEPRAAHAVFVVDTDAAEAQAWLRERHPELRIMSAGQAIEIYKEMGLPRDFVDALRARRHPGSHALGHTRMATESRVTTEHSHPFSTGLDLCLVHNGSLSNHNRLRRRLRREGIEFQTDNDTEVAAGYLTWRLREGALARAGARGLPRRPRRLLHVRRRDGRRLRGAARPDRVQAGGDGRDRRLGRDGVRVPRDRGPAGRRDARDWEPEPGACTAGSGSASDGDRRVASRPRSSTSRSPRCASSTPPPRARRRRRPRRWRVVNPSGAHALAVGLDAPVEVEIEGHVGYYCAGMNKQATVRVHGNAGVGVAENIMSGTVVVDGNASQSAGATGRGGLVVVHGNASARCGISMKGVDIVVAARSGT